MSSPDGLPSSVRILNPLGLALAHYSRELSATLSACGCRVTVAAVAEPSALNGRILGRLTWSVSYLREVFASGDWDLVVCIWPAFGYWETLLLALSRGQRRALVVHDPEPLVRSVGYGPMGRILAQTIGRRVSLVAHSKKAREVMVGKHRLGLVNLVHHPMLLPERAASERGAATVEGVRTVRVLGQYKPDRDLAALAQIARAGGFRWSLEIVGRGWPEVRGWTIRDEFVGEDEFETLIASADAVVIPYRRFFQSGVAVRALELLTPVVAPQVDSVVSLLGEDCEWTVAGDEWVSAVENALDAEPAEVTARAEQAKAASDRSWSDWLARTL